MSIHSSTFPKLWKMGKITPLFKKGSTQDPGNYRPISILPVLSKLLEKHVAIHLLEFLNSHDLLHSQQSGFRAKHSCKTALHYMLNDWLSSAHADEFVGVMFIDFCKAFDLVDHKLLLEKLKLYKFSQSALHWFTCYLTERQQCVKVNSICDPLPQNEAGVAALYFELWLIIDDLGRCGPIWFFCIFSYSKTLSCMLLTHLFLSDIFDVQNGHFSQVS